MFARRADLPFDRDESGHFLPWIVAMMVFLAALSLAGALTLGGRIEEWDSSLRGRLTVQIPRGEGVAEASLERVLSILHDTPGVVATDVMSRDDAARLLEPWLGAFAADENLPLPYLIDVSLAVDAEIDTAVLTARLSDGAPGVAVDDHRVWLADFIGLARTVQILAYAIVVIVGFGAIAAVVFVTRSSLAVHHHVIELLHQMGAQDRYVARQFQGHALSLAVRGAVIGGIAATAALLAIGYAGRNLEAALLPGVGLTPWSWATLALVPVVVALIAMLTARVTALRSLARMP